MSGLLWVTVDDTTPMTLADRVFDNEMNYLIELADEHYTAMNYREVLKTACYEYQVSEEGTVLIGIL